MCSESLVRVDPAAPDSAVLAEDCYCLLRLPLPGLRNRRIIAAVHDGGRWSSVAGLAFFCFCMRAFADRDKRYPSLLLPSL
jgi:hypothetical protein